MSSLYKTGNSVPSSAMPDVWDNNRVQDGILNSSELEVETRTGDKTPTWRGVLKQNADAIKEAQDSITILGLPFATLSDAQTAANEGKIPEDSTTYVRSSDRISLADEYINNNGTLIATGRGISSQYAVDMKSITSGDIFPSLPTRGAAMSGGSVITDASNRIIGLFVPAGSSGASSYFCTDIPATLLRGKRVKITQVYTASDNFIINASLNDPKAQYRTGVTVTALEVADYSIIQTGNTVTQTGTVIIPNNADYVGLVIQYSSNAPIKSADLSVQLAQVAYVMPGVSGSVATENDRMLDIRLAPALAAAAASQATADSALLTSGNVYHSGTSQVFAGAEKITDSSGDPIGLRIPANAGTGQSSFLTSFFSASGMSGRTINIVATYDTTARFNTDPAPNTLALQVLRGSSTVNISVGSGVTRSITQSGTMMTIALQYTVTPDDINIGVCYQIAGGGASRDYERKMQVRSIFYSLVPEAGRTRNDAMLEVYVAAEIAKIDPGGTDTGDGYAVIKTVKPSGGDFTHPKLAIDAITDASASNRYCLAVYPGEYTGYAEWYTKDFVDIIGIGRKEEIIVSYDSGDNADEATVRNTSLFWMASQTLLKNITWKLKNGRYVIHMESNGARPDITLAIEDCSVIHEGNASNTYWWQPSQYGVGAGLSAGNTVRLRNSYFEGRGGGFSFHTPNNRVAYTSPITVDVEGCTFKNSRTNTNTEYPYAGSFWIKPITKGAADTCRLVGNTFIGGGVYYSTGEWLDTSDTTTNRAQVQVWGYGNAGFSFYSNEPYTPSMTGINQ